MTHIVLIMATIVVGTSVLRHSSKGALGADTAQAEDIWCAHSIPGAEHPPLSIGMAPPIASTNASSIASGMQATAGAHRSLIIFVRFRDDSFDSEHGIWPQWRSSDAFPSFGSDFLVPASTRGEAPSPPYAPHTLTDYFYRQSNEQWLLYGEAYPEVLVTEEPEAAYRISGTATAGLRALTIEVLDKLDANGWDFSEYDADGDGRVDNIFIILRNLHNVNWGGYSLLGGGPNLSYDGKEVDMNTSGIYIRTNFGGNSLPPLTMGRLMAHEYGHDLWGGFFNHLSGIDSNDVPSNHTRYLGYTLMAGGVIVPREGNINTDKAGNETISAFERDLIGWIDCRPLQNSRNNITVGGLYSTGDCYRFDLVNGGTIYISNLQRTNYFDQLYSFPTSLVPHEDGLMSTGMMVGLRRGTQYDELPADNTIEIGIWSSVYDGDLYSPETAVQITPWTRPNINGFTRYPADYAVSWQAIDNVRESAGSNMLFDFVADFRTQPVIRKDSWMGAETSGHTFSSDIIVEGGATLEITSGTIIHLADEVNIIVEQGGTLSVEPAARIEMGRNSRLVSNGRVDADTTALPIIEGLRR